MLKLSIALIATMVAGWVVVGSATSANARYLGCNCGPGSSTSTYYKTSRPTQFLTRYHDKSVYNHVQRIHRVVNVTRVQPIIHIHDITRIHHRTIFHTNDVYSQVVQRLPPIRSIRYSIENTYDCNCGR